MSYNAYNYSPYYQQQAQQPVTGNGNGNGQPEHGNSNIPYYRSLADVPSQRTHNGSAQYPANTTPEHYGTGYAYPSYRSTATTEEENTQQATKTGAQPSSTYYDATSRSYTDTSALGSLAYASALGRGGKSTDQNQNNSPQHQAPAHSSASQFSYGSNVTAVNGCSQARSDSRGSSKTNRNSGLNNTSSVSPYASSIAANALAQTQQFSRAASPQYHHRPEQSSTRQAVPAAQNPGYSSKSLGQSYTVGSQDSPSVNAATAISLPPVQNTKSRESPRSNEPQYRPSLPAAYSVARTEAGDASYHNNTSSYQAVPSTQQNKGPATFATSAETPYYGTQIQSRSSSTVNALREDLHSQSRQFISTNAAPNQNSKNLPQNTDPNRNTQREIEQHPVTVDPNQVFNVYEYQRRKAEAEAEAAKKAADQRSLQDRPSTSSSGSVKQAATAPTSAAGAAIGPNAKQSSAETGSKEQIEAEIKAMIEKMREYKAKDPAVFSEVWERFKQVQPPPGASSQSLQTPKEPQGTAVASRQDREIASPGFMDNSMLPSPSPVLAQHPSIPDNNPGNLPDLGRFPYQRRRRGKTDKGKSNESRMSDVLNAEDLASSELDASVIDPRLSASNISAVMQISGQQQPATVIPPSEKSARQILQSFHGGREPSADTSTTSYSSPYYARTSKEGSSTIWPEHKKTALAIVGKNILESYAVNTGKTISVDNIRSMLDQDPSYDQLCQILESRGFVFERAEFARRLLDAVPHTETDPKTPLTAPGPIKKPRRTPASDSPRRPRGRPRKDGLPPRQSHVVQNRIDAETLTAPMVYPNGYVPASDVTASSLGTNQVLTTVQDSGDQRLASALQTAITQIDSQMPRPAMNDRSVANTGRPYMNIPRPPYTINNNKGGSASYSAGDAARDALKWSASRQYSLETLKNDNMINPQTGKMVRSMSRPSPLGFGAPNGSGSQVNVGQIAQYNNPQASGAAKVSTPIIPTKEQMARKRNFNEIVDLTQDIDEEDAQRQKRARLAQLASFTSNNSTDNIGSTSHSHPTALTAPEAVITENAAPAIIQNGMPLISGTSDTANNGRINLSQYKAPNSGITSSREALRLGQVVQELNKNDALKKSIYNVKTLARDILISKGIHPTERPLNWHLDSLRGNFRSVTNTSDLSTFRWDLVDPGGPKISHAVCEVETKAQDADDEAGEPFHAPSYITTRGRRRGRPPRSRGAVRGNISSVHSLDAFRSDVNSLVRNMRPSRGGRGGRSARGSHSRRNSHEHTSTTRQSPRSTNVIDIADGITPNQMSPPPRPMASSTAGSSALQSSLSKSVDNHGSPNNRYQFGSDGSADVPVAPVAKYGSATSLVVRVPGVPSVLDQTSSTTPRSRGRPPGSANKSATSETGPKKRGRPVGSGAPSRGRPSGRGRPVSYRTEVPEDGIGILMPSRSPSSSSHLSHVEAIPEVEKRKKGRKSRQAVTPSFQVFKCQWLGCGSELHNLETLRRHIYKIHSRVESSDGEPSVEAVQKKIPCLWIGCEQEGVFSSTTGIMKFEDLDSWKAHVERAHLETVAWELGDGPSTHPSDVEPSSYLSDTQGRTVTPLVRTTGPPDPLPPGSGRSPTRAYHRAHGNVTEHQKSQAELNSQVATKQVAGVFIGRDKQELEDPQVEQESSDEESDSDDTSNP
ncbi:hypothetical protein MMC27_007138 [Xylographa pallens]|nr:hypothetical protein [Xylographa pallens]